MFHRFLHDKLRLPDIVDYVQQFILIGGTQNTAIDNADELRIRAEDIREKMEASRREREYAYGVCRNLVFLVVLIVVSLYSST